MRAIVLTICCAGLAACGGDSDSGASPDTDAGADGVSTADVADAATDGESTSDVRRPTLWLGDDASVPQPDVLPLAERDTALTAALRAGTAPNFIPLVNVYETWMARADAECPVIERASDEEYGDVEVWSGDCTTGAGVRFRGSARYARADDQALPDGKTRTRRLLQWTDGFRIEAPDGASVSGDLYLDQSRTTNPDSREFGVYMEGRFNAANSPELAAAGLTMPFRGQFSAYMGKGIEQPWVYQQFSATLARGPEGFVGATYDDLVFENYGVCSLEPRGAVSIRHASGVWYDLVFDAVDAENVLVDEALCDGCGNVWVQGVAQDPFCLPEGLMQELGDRELPW